MSDPWVLGLIALLIVPPCVVIGILLWGDRGNDG